MAGYAKPKPKRPKPKAVVKPPKFGDIGIGPKIDPRAGTIQDNTAIGRVVNRDPEKARIDAVKRNEVIRRQVLLKSQGFGIVIDGVWGSRSQNAWNEWQARNRGVPFKPGIAKKNSLNLTLDREAIKRQEKAKQEAAEEIQLRKQQEKIAARKLAQKQRVAAKAQVLDTARRLHRDPTVARGLKFKALAGVLLDPESKMGVSTPTGARVFQEWAAANGYSVQITGEYDKQTHALVERVAVREERREVKRRVNALRANFYAPLGLLGGEKPSWWNFKDPVPTPKEFNELIQGGDFTTSLKFNAMMEQIANAPKAWDQVKHGELLKAARKLQPFGAAGMADLLGDDNAVSSFQLYSDLLGITDFSPYADVSGAKDEAEQLYLRNIHSENKETRQENLKRLGRHRAELHSLMTSSTPEEFNSKLAAHLELQAKKFQDFQKELAGENLPFWGKALEKLIAPGEILRTALVYDTLIAAQGVDRLLGADTDIQRTITWEDAKVVLGSDPDDLNFYHEISGDTEFDDNALGSWGGVARFSLEWTADPLNFAHPFRVGSTGFKYATRSDQLGRYKIATEGTSLIEKAWNSKLVFQKGTWSKAGAFNAATLGIAGRSDAFKKFANVATQLRDEAVNNARSKVGLQVKHGFDPKSGKKHGGDTWKIKSADTQAKLDKSRAAVAKHIEESDEFGFHLDDLRSSNSSLYVDAARTQLSQVGAAYYAQLAERARFGVIHQIATSRAWKVWEANVVDFDAVESRLNGMLDGTMDSEQQRRMLIDQEKHMIADKAVDAYNEVIDSASTYLGGSAIDPDGALRGSTKSLARMIDNHVNMRLDVIRDSIFPVMQDLIEKNADDLFEASKLPKPVGVKHSALDQLTTAIANGDEAAVSWIKENAKLSRKWKAREEAIREWKSRLQYLKEWDALPAHQKVGDRPIAGVERKNGTPIAMPSFVGLDPPMSNAEIAAKLGFKDIMHDADDAVLREPVKHPLWDDEGLWRHRNSDLAKNLRVLGRDSFEPDALVPVPNPQHGIGFKWAEASEHIEAEIRRMQGRLQWYTARNITAKTLRDGFDIMAKQEELRAKIIENWDEHGGLWYDKRETIEASALYARHRLDAFKRKKGDRNLIDPNADTGEERLKMLAAPPAIAGESFEDAMIWKQTWAMGTQVRGSLPFDRYNVPFSSTRRTDPFQFDKTGNVITDEKGFDITYKVQRDAQEAKWNEFRENLTRHQHALAKGFDEAMPKYLREQQAYFQALAHSKEWYAKVTYLTLKGMMNTWVFATLPLRLGWFVRNHIDNTAKLIVQGVRDPRLFFQGGKNPGQSLRAIRSIFDGGLNNIRHVIRFYDDLFMGNGRAVEAWDNLVGQIWELPTEVLSKIFTVHGIDVPEAALKESQQSFFEGVGSNAARPRVDMEEAWRLGLEKKPGTWTKRRGFFDGLTEETRDLRTAKTIGERFREGAWELVGNMPENNAKRIMYRVKYAEMEKKLRSEGTFLRNRNLTDEQKAFVKGIPNEVSVSIDETQLRELAEKYLGREFAGKIEFRLRTVSRAEYLNGPQGQAKFWEWKPGTKELQLQDDPWIEVLMPNNALVDTAERAKELEKRITTVIHHELRHALQAKRPFASLTWKWDVENLPYRKRLGEIDARLFAKWKARNDGSLVQVKKPDGSFFPHEHDEAEIALAAHEFAWSKVEETLFDYSKITVHEDNFRVFFPFVQFWRKNSTFWAKSFASRPWMTNGMLQYDQERRDAHGDLPLWMQRYMHVDEITDAAAVVPGLGAVVDAMLPQGVQYDPTNFLSFSPFYRTFKQNVYGQNQTLPGEEDPVWLGQAIFGPMIDSMSDFGLGTNPFFRKPLESAHIANERSWQTVFPQTSPIVALSREFFNESLALTVADWERIFTLWQGEKPSDQIADNFDYFVQQEIATQALRGEKLDRERAEKVISTWFLTQNIWGYFAGTYLRRAAPEDVALATMHNDLLLDKRQWEGLTDTESRAINLWTQRGYDRLAFDRYLDLLPLIESYYRTDSWEEKLRIKNENPEIIRWVDATWRGKGFSGKLLKHSVQAIHTEQFRMALDVVNHVDPPYALRQAALDMFATPELRKFWESNDTEKQIRDRMVDGEIHDYYAKMSASYFEIPADDYDSRDAFIEDHPDLIRHWNRNNSFADNMGAIWHGANAALREEYFAIRDAKGWDGAASFLKKHPYMFEDTKSADKVNELTGEWKGGGGKGKFSAARLADFKKAKPYMRWFFDVYMKKVGEKKAWAWLEQADGPGAMLIKDYLKKWGKHSQKSIDYLKARKWLEIYFALPDSEKGKWLSGGSEGARLVLDFFQKYGKGAGEHAEDYLAAKKQLDFYFAMPKAKRRAWLDAGSPDAKIVLAYFKKYGKSFQQERAFLKKYPGLSHGTPEQRKRLEFWRRYYSLTPDQRPLFVHQNAEKYGIYIYGEFGEQEIDDREAEYMRRAVGAGLNKKQAAYLYVRPLLDFYKTLPKNEKALFLRANPELQEYFDEFKSKDGISGNKALDAKIERYFKLPPDSLARSAFLGDNPDVQDYFDSKSSPADRAMRNLLEQFFAIEGNLERNEFKDTHPEIEAYFDRKRVESTQERDTMGAFDQADPRLRRYYEEANDVIRAADEMRLRLLKQARDMVTGIGSSRDRLIDESGVPRTRL